MGINVLTTMGFENRELLKNVAKEILLKNDAELEKANEIVKNAVLGTDLNSSSDLSVLKASTQVTLNNSLKETLKYLQAHANDKRKKYVFGELWDILGAVKKTTNESSYEGALLDFEIDKNAKNIFAA